MTSARLVHQVLALLSFSVFIQSTECHPVSQYVRDVNLSAPETFVQSVFDEFGSNNSMNSQQFNLLLKELSIGSSSSEQASKIGNKKCYSAKELLESFSVDSNGLNLDKFEKVCPAIVQQIESKACLDEIEDTKKDVKQSKARAWGFGFLSVTIISCASLLGVFVVPFMNQTFYKILLLFMVSLAVGVLSGSGFFHLIPQAYQIPGLANLWKSLVIVGGIYLFFLLEYVMKMIVRFKEKSESEDDNQTEIIRYNGVFTAISNIFFGTVTLCYSGVPLYTCALILGTVAAALEKPEGKSELLGSGIAEVQLQLYNRKPDQHLSLHSMSDIPNVFNGSVEKRSSNECEVIVNTGGKRKVAPVAWMIIIGDGLHNFIDGLAIGASYSSSTYVGISTSLAIFCEELPHELGDFAILLNAGMSYKMAMAFNFLSACACYLGLIIGLILGTKTSAVKWIYPLAGGMFVYISLVDMLEEASEMSARIGEDSIWKNLKTFALQNFGMLFGFVIMFILAVYQISLD